MGSIEAPMDGEETRESEPMVPHPPPDGGIVAWAQVLVAFFLFFSPW
jgi:hypothetical protein